jgi:hypothetical protein
MNDEFSNDQSEQVVERYGRRSAFIVYCLTLFDIILVFWVGLVGWYRGGLAWLLIAFPLAVLCFAIIPSVHFVCRELLRLQRRVKELEKRLERQNA